MSEQEKKRIHLVCNAHLDPEWLWEWEEGAAAMLGTFRQAAEFCDEYEGEAFIFNHNEVILYRWVEEYEPELFVKIQRLVKEGKWHIMGGWYLQPDCNMTSGESFVRQIMLGRQYFKNKFGKVPTTAINFDPFGHTRGLVQILAKSGYDSYIFCRPEEREMKLEAMDFIWEGYDGSQVMAHRSHDLYLSFLGKASKKVEEVKELCADQDDMMVLWGVGNHGGGASRKDLAMLKDLKEKLSATHEVVHSTPENYFEQLAKRKDSLPVRQNDLNSTLVGCYTTQIRIKQKHRQLENYLFMTEKMSVFAWSKGLMKYPEDELREAMYDLAKAEFHDILPGSSIEAVEEAGLRVMDHGLEILSRVKARAFFALAKGQPRAKEGETPILIYNPHPFPIKTVVECEFQLENQNREDSFTDIFVYQNDQLLPCQVEDEQANLPLDWRKKVSFIVELAPTQMTRVDCREKVIPKQPKPPKISATENYVFDNGEMRVEINPTSGLIDSYIVAGKEMLKKGGAKFLVLHDDEDAWGTDIYEFRNVIGEFTLLSPKRAAKFAGVHVEELQPVRIVENGNARVTVEALFGYGDSYICQRYHLAHQGSELEMETRVHWNEKQRFLKMSLATVDQKPEFYGQVAYGYDRLFEDGRESVAQRWMIVKSEQEDSALSVITDSTYGSDFKDGELRVSMLRSPAYAGMNLFGRKIMKQDRYSPRIDQGHHIYRTWLNASSAEGRFKEIERESIAHNEKPMALAFFPSGKGDLDTEGFIKLSEGTILVTAIKKAEESDDIIIRLFESSGNAENCIVDLPGYNISEELKFGPYEIKTLSLNPQTNEFKEVSLVEVEL
ncbi:putative alpha-mannosidase [Lentisphaera araneosa HTCC2155]|uniref:Putative alpha-mannosidase n=1 Tax=Lentisphaera araneosa HTCC2155 TaxID=313628 RepID=A6DNH9_9BACT|nr:alpha-mannosidase [Lentisphaera araneosa]EDM26927.1 putative alpha-mannosidase [Lentisphaera araneosa HTCC2155]